MTPWLRITKITKQGIFLAIVFKNTFVNSFHFWSSTYYLKKKKEEKET